MRIEQAIYDRRGDGAGDLECIISDRSCTQYLSNGATPSGWKDAGIERCRSNSRGDAYDNALAETIIGLFKTEVISTTRPVEVVTCDAVEARHARVGRLVQHPCGYWNRSATSRRRSTKSVTMSQVTVT